MRRIRLIVCLLLLVLATESLTADEPSSPISLHPDNPHYFIWRGEPTVLVTSGEHYGALLNRDFDYVRYFDELMSHGLNHSRVFTGTYREDISAFQITDNTLAPKPDAYLCPWARSDTPGYKDGGNKFDLQKWDPEWFARLRDLMQQAMERGIVVELTLFCPMYNETLWGLNPMNSGNNVNGIGQVSLHEVYTLNHHDLLDAQIAVTRKIVRELRDFGNLYYEVCNEPYFGGVTMDWQHKIVDTIVDEEQSFATKHLISLNVANGRQKVEQPHPSVSIFNFHYCVPPDTVALNFALNKVIGENETGFRGSEDILYRTEAWDFMLAGGALYNNLDYSFTTAHPDGSLRDYKSPGGGSLALRQQLGILKRFLDSFDFERMVPDNSVIQSVSPKLTASALVETGQAYAIYFHVPLPDKPKDLSSLMREDIEATAVLSLPEGSYVAEWINVTTGESSQREVFVHPGGDKQLTSPNFANDVALRLVVQKSS